MPLFHRLTVALARTPADAAPGALCRPREPAGRRARVCLVHVLRRERAGQPARMRDAEAELRAACRPRICRRRRRPAVRTAVLSGPLTDRLLSFVAESQTDLVMVGHGAGHSGRRALARRLAMKAPCSVWMVPDGSPARISRILAPIDFSPALGRHAANRLVAGAGRRRGLPALHVYFNEAVVTYEEYDQVLRGQERRAYDKFIAPLDSRGVELTPHFEESANAAHAIERVAEREAADLIVMGTRGRSRSAAILLGSVTEQTLIETRLPLLAVKHFGARMGVLEALLDRRLSVSQRAAHGLG